MLTASIIAIVCGVLFMASFTRATIGFGDSLLAMPLLVLVIGVKSATPIVAFSASLLGLGILYRRWRQVNLQAVWRLFVASLVGIPVGLWLLKSVPEAVIKPILGVLLVLFGARHFLPKPAPARDEPQAAQADNPNAPDSTKELPPQELGAWLAGFVAGMLGGAYNLNGPPVVLYATLRRWPSEQFVATMQGYFLPTGLLIVMGHGLAGLWTREVLVLTAWAVPFVLLGLVLGSWLHEKIKPGAFDSLVFAFIIAMGAVLVASSW